MAATLKTITEMLQAMNKSETKKEDTTTKLAETNKEETAQVTYND
jgi:hypothetical protein